MRFALDATPLTLTSGGLPRYVSQLSTALATTFYGDWFHLMSDQPFPSLPLLHKLPGPRNWLERRWWLRGAECVCARADIDLFHGTNFAIPYFARRPTVLTVLDLSPWMDRAWHTGANRVRRHTPRMIKRATMTLTISQAVRRQIIQHFHLAPELVAAVPLAAPANYGPVPPSRQKTPPYFLFVGTLEPRKNIPALLEAWREVRRTTDVDLVLAGRRRSDFPSLPYEHGLRILGEVSEASLPQLYSDALALVYPSHYEGFGLPVLEAMQCGACVITSRDPAISEVAGDAAMYATEPTEIAAAMRAVIANPTLRAEHRSKSLTRARDFSWERTARQTYEVYREAMARFARS